MLRPRLLHQATASASSSRPPTTTTTLALRTFALSAVHPAEPSSPSSQGPPPSGSSSSSSRPTRARSAAASGNNGGQQPRLGDSRGRGRSEGGVNLNYRPQGLRRGDGGSALGPRPSPSGGARFARPSARPSDDNDPRFADAPSSSSSSFIPRPDLVQKDVDAYATRLNPKAYRNDRVVPPVRPPGYVPGGYVPRGGSSGGGRGGREAAGGMRGGGGPGRGGAMAGAGAGRGGRGGGGSGRGGGRSSAAGGARASRKAPAYTGEAFLPSDSARRPTLAPATLPANVELYTTDDFLLASNDDRPLVSPPSSEDDPQHSSALPETSPSSGGTFPPQTPFYAKLRAEVFASAPTSGLRVLKHRTPAAHLLTSVGTLGPSAKAAASKLVGELPMVLSRGAKREDQGLLTQAVEELDPTSGAWKPAGEVDYTAEIARTFDPFKPGKPHPPRRFRLTTRSTLVDDEVEDQLAADVAAAADSLTEEGRERREARKQLYRSQPAVQLITLEHPPAPAGATDGSDAHRAKTAELLALIERERAQGDYGRWANGAELDRSTARFVAGEGNGGGAFRQGRKAALDLSTIGLAWAGNNLSGRERALQKAVIEGLVKQ